MNWVLYMVSVMWVAGGAAMVLYPAQCRKAGAVLLESKRSIKALSILTGVLGFLLVIAAVQRQLPWIVPILGVIAIIKAVLLFWNPANLLITLQEWVSAAHRGSGLPFFRYRVARSGNRIRLLGLNPGQTYIQEKVVFRAGQFLSKEVSKMTERFTLEIFSDYV